MYKLQCHYSQQLSQVTPYKLEIIVIDRGWLRSYDSFMDEADKKVIEELLAKQTESFSRVMDARLQEQDKRLDVRFKEQEERLEKRMIHIFNEGFEQVVLPHIADIKEDISAMKEDIEDLRSTQARMDRKLDAVVERQDRQGEDIKGIKKFVQMPEGA